MARERKTKKKKDILGEGTELGAIAGDIRKRMGEHSVSKGSASLGFNHIETGIFMIDFATFGGIQEGRVSQFYGHEASGKTTLAMRCGAAAQRKYPDGAVVIIDAEGTFDMRWAEYHGMDTERIVYCQPESGEEAVDILEAVMRAKETIMVIVDSLPALVPQKIIDKSAEDNTVAERARLIGIACSKILSASQAERARNHFPTVIIINQWRTKIGVMFGDPRVLPGGSQPRYLSSLMLEMKKKKQNTGRDHHDIETVFHNDHAFKIDKLKGGSSILQGEFEMICHAETGLEPGTINDFRTVGVYAKRMGLITGGGASWRIDGIDRKFSKLADIEQFLKDEPEEFLTLKRRMIMIKREEMGLPAIPKDGYLLGYAEDT